MTKAFKREIASLEILHLFVSQFITKHGLNDSLSYYADFVVEELFTNAVKYNPDSQKDVSVALTINNNQFIIVIIDEDGEPFDITKTDPFDRTTPAEKRRIGGLGIPLVKQMADKIEYRRHGKTNKTTIIKYLE